MIPGMDICKSLYILFIVLFCESLCTQHRTSFGDRIAGGRITKIQLHPYHVVLKESRCGGSIIGRRWIISAAHCNRHNTSKVLVGSSRMKKGTRYKIKSVKIIPTYKNFGGDLMLLELKTPLVYGPKVQPIQIGRKFDIVAGNIGIVTGFGRTSLNGQKNDVLRKAAITILGIDNCKYIWNESFDERSEICAGNPEWEGGHCKGDSGGPFVVNGKLVGVVSYGGCRGRPGVYTSVPNARLLEMSFSICAIAAG